MDGRGFSTDSTFSEIRDWADNFQCGALYIKSTPSNRYTTNYSTDRKFFAVMRDISRPVLDLGVGISFNIFNFRDYTVYMYMYPHVDIVNYDAGPTGFPVFRLHLI